MSDAKTCLKRYYYRYHLRLRKVQEPTPLRIGRAVHIGLEDGHLDRVSEIYASFPEWCLSPDEQRTWAIERAKVRALLTAYYDYWSDDALETYDTELKFEFGLPNPRGKHEMSKWRVAGKIDKIVKLPDGRLAVMEHKTSGEDVGLHSDYWRRLRIDQQISLYMLAARASGYDVETVLYDVIRKPTIRPKKTPVLDEDGLKILLDTEGHRVYNNNGTPKQSGKIEKRTEHPNEFEARLIGDIASRPEFYFVRREIPRLDSDLNAFKRELWAQQKLLTYVDEHKCFFKNTHACLRPFRCEYLDVCHQGIDPKNHIPEGFTVATEHPELEEE
jgi:hypothetical protein